MNELATTSEPEHQPRPGEEKLSKRELEVAIGISSGLSGHDIAQQLGIAKKTFDTHRLRVKKKLRIKNNVQLTYYALRAGWVSL